MTRLARALDVPLDVAAWSAVAAGTARLVLSSAARGGRPALRLDFDFNGGAGFVVARCPVHDELSEDYTIAFCLRGTGPANDLEIKLVDASGQNVWRHVHENLQPPARWKPFRVDSRAFEFAWGPASGDVPKHLGGLTVRHW